MAGSISVSGLSTGLDTSSIVSQLIGLKRRPIDLISANKDVLDTELSELQNLNTRLLSFQSLVKDLSSTDKFLAETGSFSNNNASDNNQVVTLDVGSKANSGSYSLEVNSMAKTEIEASQGFASSSSTISRGTFFIQVGSTTTSITIDSSNDTLSGLKNAINNSGLDATASIIDDGSGNGAYRLSIASKTEGTDNTLSISHAAKIALGGGISTVAPVLSFTETQTATDASFTFGGLEITRSSNTISDVLEGVSINIGAVGSGTITLEPDTATVKANIENFVSEYNELTTYMNEQLLINAETGETGTLFGNPAVVSLQNQIRAAITSQVPGLVNNTDTFIAISQIGIKTGSQGLLEIDSGTLTDATSEDLEAVATLFAASGSSNTSGLVFTGFTEDTEGGTYEVQVSGGQVQTAASGTSTFVDSEFLVNYYSGATSASESGLGFILSSTTNGSKGYITFSLGVAAQLERILDNLTDKSKEGPLKSELDTLTTNIKDIEDTIESQEARLAEEEENLTRKFAALEAFVSRMKSQGDFLTQIQAGLIAGAKAR